MGQRRGSGASRCLDRISGAREYQVELRVIALDLIPLPGPKAPGSPQPAAVANRSKPVSGWQLMYSKR